MPAKHKRFVVYPDDTAAAQLEVVRAYYEKKNQGMPVKVTDGYIGRELIRQKYTDVVNETTNSLTIKNVYAEVAALRSEVVELKALIEQMRQGKNQDV